MSPIRIGILIVVFMWAAAGAEASAQRGVSDRPGARAPSTSTHLSLGLPTATLGSTASDGSRARQCPSPR